MSATPRTAVWKIPEWAKIAVGVTTMVVGMFGGLAAMIVGFNLIARLIAYLPWPKP